METVSNTDATSAHGVIPYYWSSQFTDVHLSAFLKTFSQDVTLSLLPCQFSFHNFSKVDKTF